jgi:hypothetical protein
MIVLFSRVNGRDMHKATKASTSSYVKSINFINFQQTNNIYNKALMM